LKIGESRPPFEWKSTELAEDSWVGVEAPAEKVERKHCIMCDAPLRPGEIRCPECGANQVTGLVQRRKPKTEDRDPWEAVDSPSRSSAQVVLAGRIAARIADWIRSGTCLPGSAKPISPGDIMILVRRRNAFAEEMIRQNLQARAAAIIHRYGELGHPARPVFDLMLRYAVSEDGALHAEKFYRTVSEEFSATRPAFRWRHLVALARVTASEFGRPAGGIAEARVLLKV